MSAAKKGKIHDEGRDFNSEWCSKYLIVPRKQGVVCLVCQNMIAVMKEYNVKYHYATNHSSQFYEFLGQTRVDKIEHLKTSIEKQQCVFTSYKEDSELVAILNFRPCESMMENGKPVGDV